MGIFDEGVNGSDNNAADSLRAVPSVLLHDAVLAAVAKGWLVSFGRGRDGFAASLSVFADGQKSRVWCEDTASLEKALERLLSAATAVEGEVADTAAKKPRRAKS